MKYFYYIILIVSVFGFIADLVLRYTVKIKSFDFHRRLFEFKNGDPIVPVNKFLPDNLTMLLFTLIITSMAGVLFSFAGLAWFLSFPFSAAGGLTACFVVQYLWKNAADSVKKNNLPKGEDAAGLDGYCAEDIPIGEWGKVRLFHKDREFEAKGACAGETPLEKGDKVVAAYESGGFYFVFRIDELYKE
jgi:membrane protein implicated in regulation of membrane protease activity